MRRTQTDPKIVIGYLRVSTDEQALGPEAQRQALERWCRDNGARLVAVHQDLGVSGAAPLDERPGLLAAIDELARTKAGVLLIAKRCRLARDVVVAAMAERLVERQGARILTADGTGNGDGPEAQLMRGLVDLFGMYERAIIATRTRAAMAVKRGRGELVGAVPIGKRLAADGVRLEEEPDEAAAVERARDLRARGASYRAIAQTLTAEGHRPRGERWHGKSVARMVAA